MDKKQKHLEFLQNVIIRMNSNSFLIKGWTITLVSALFMLATRDANVKYVIISYFAIPVFWILDGFYLSQERQYRDLYNDVTKRSDSEIDFSMNASDFNSAKNTWFCSIFSKTSFLFYSISIAIVFTVLNFIN